MFKLENQSIFANSALVPNKHEKTVFFLLHRFALTVSVNRDTSTKNFVALIRWCLKKDARLLLKLVQNFLRKNAVPSQIKLDC